MTLFQTPVFGFISVTSNLVQKFLCRGYIPRQKSLILHLLDLRKKQLGWEESFTCKSIYRTYSIFLLFSLSLSLLISRSLPPSFFQTSAKIFSLVQEATGDTKGKRVLVDAGLIFSIFCGIHAIFQHTQEHSH